MRTLIFGKDGQLGHALLGECATGAQRLDVVAHGRGDTDLSVPGAVTETLEAVAPKLIVNAAAYTAVDRAEEEVQLAQRINADAVAEMGRYAARAGAVLLHVSTDYVFDGASDRPYREDDATGPLNCYGQSKLDGERYLLEQEAPALILRTAWVYSLQRESFVRTMIRLAKKHRTLQVVSDQIGSPTWSVALARAIVSLVAELGPDPFARVESARGIYHLAGTGFVSRHGLVEAMLQIGSRDHAFATAEVKPVTSERFPTPARRPRYTAMDCTLAAETFHVSLPGWKESLAEALATQEA